MREYIIINPLKRAQITKCDTCGENMYPSDITEQYNALPSDYPYEGKFDVFLCPKCGHITIVPEDDRIFVEVSE